MESTRLKLVWRCLVSSVLSTIREHFHWVYSQTRVWDLIRYIHRSCLWICFLPGVLARVLVALRYWRSVAQILVLLVPWSSLRHLLILHELLLLRSLHLLIHLILLSRIEVPAACCPCLMSLIIVHSSWRRWHLLLVCGTELALLIQVLLQHELIVHLHLLVIVLIALALRLN